MLVARVDSVLMIGFMDESADGKREEVEARVKGHYVRLSPVMNERVARLWAATEAQTLGRGGVALVARATGMSPRRIAAGVKELDELAAASPVEAAPQAQRIRRAGAGRPPLTETNPEVLGRLQTLVDPGARGDPEAPLRWTIKSVRTLAAELGEHGHEVSASKVGDLLKRLGYSLQAPRKKREGTQHPDRNAQFEYINGKARSFQRRGQPVISVDTKKKELVGDFKNGGRDWHPKGAAPEVCVHDFVDKELGKAIPYGVYDVGRNEGWVSVGIDHDTAEFAVESIWRWWREMGRAVYPKAADLLITADAGGSNAPRTRLWKRELQRLANDAGLRLTVCHYPPGTSKWNKIEHRLFCHITRNWRGRPLESRETIVSLIAATSTTTGLRVRAALDTKSYEKGIKVTAADLADLHIKPHAFHGDWNYDVRPN
jgi:hypothetical protein